MVVVLERKGKGERRGGVRAPELPHAHDGKHVFGASHARAASRQPSGAAPGRLHCGIWFCFRVLPGKGKLFSAEAVHPMPRVALRPCSAQQASGLSGNGRPRIVRQGNRMKLREWRSAQCCFQKVIIPASALPANTHAGFSRQTFKHV